MREVACVLTCGGRTLEFWRVMLLSMAATRWILMVSASMHLGVRRGGGWGREEGAGEGSGAVYEATVTLQ